MKTFVLTETTTVTKRFTAAEYRAYFGRGESSQDEIQKRLNNDNGQYHDLLISCPFGEATSDRETTWTIEESR